MENTEKQEGHKLNEILHQWGNDASDQNYGKVMQEILEGKSTLLIPVLMNDGKMQISSIFNHDEFPLLLTFSDEAALTGWTKEKTQFAEMPSKEVLDFCAQNEIHKIVINPDQTNEFVLERKSNPVKSVTLQEDVQVKVGKLPYALPASFISKLNMQFQKVDAIQEAYQYGQLLNNEVSTVLGIRLSVVSDEAIRAAHEAFGNALEGETLENPISMIMIETDDWYQTVKEIGNSLFYQK